MPLSRVLAATLLLAIPALAQEPDMKLPYDVTPEWIFKVFFAPIIANPFK